MKISWCFFVLGFFTQSSVADNSTFNSSAQVHNNDYTNLTAITQAGNWLDIKQQGSNNTVIAKQSGHKQRGQLSQKGHSNRIKLTQHSDADYIARIDQRGNDNTAEVIQQKGRGYDYGYVAIYQQNGGKSITINQLEHEFIEINQF